MTNRVKLNMFYYFLFLSRHYYSLWLDIIKYLLQCNRSIFYTVEVNEDQETCGASRQLWRDAIRVQMYNGQWYCSLLAE